MVSTVWRDALTTPALAAFAFVFAIAAPTQTRAQELTVSVPPDSALARGLRSMAGDPISLEDAIARALDSSPQILEARAALDAARGANRRERGAFDPELFADVSVRDTETPTASAFAGAPVLEERNVTSSFGARTTLPFGTSLTAIVDASKSESNSEFQNLDPEYFANGRVELRQPLLKGFGAGTRGPLTSAERRTEAESARFSQTERDIRAETERLYWELYAAERDYVVQELIVDQANAFLEQASVRAEAGVIGPEQVASARVFLAQQRLALLDSEERLDATSDQLATGIGERPSSIATRGSGSMAGSSRLDGQRFHAIDGPMLDEPGFSSLSEDEITRLLESARTNNLTLVAARRDLAALEATAASGKWNALPSLDLIGSVGGNGLAGTGTLGGSIGTNSLFGTDTTTREIDTGFGDALSQAVSRDYPTWGVGLELSLPIGLRSGRGERDRARAEVARQEARIAQLALSLEEELRDALRRYENGNLRLELAREAAGAAAEQVRIGLIEFENGRSTAFELVRLAADLASAQQELSRALVRTATARADLYRLVGPSDEDRFVAFGRNR